MHRLVRAISLTIPFLSACCATTGTTFSSLPPIENERGQLVIVSETPPDSKLRSSGEVDCNGVLCARVIDGVTQQGVFSVHSLTPREVLIKAPGKKFIVFAGDVQFVSNPLTVQVESGKRTFVKVALVSGRELVGPSGQVGNAYQVYRIDLISENETLTKLKGLKETKLKEAFK